MCSNAENAKQRRNKLLNANIKDAMTTVNILTVEIAFFTELRPIHPRNLIITKMDFSIAPIAKKLLVLFPPTLKGMYLVKKENNYCIKCVT